MHTKENDSNNRLIIYKKISARGLELVLQRTYFRRGEVKEIYKNSSWMAVKFGFHDNKNISHKSVYNENGVRVSADTWDINGKHLSSFRHSKNNESIT